MISLLSPAIALNLLHGQIKKQIGYKYQKCDMILDVIKNDLKFNIDDEMHEIDNEALKLLFISLSKKIDENSNELEIELIIIQSDMINKKHVAIVAGKDHENKSIKITKLL